MKTSQNRRDFLKVTGAGLAGSALSSVAGMALVMVYMVFYYRASGINAVLALALNLVLVLGMMAAISAPCSPTALRTASASRRAGAVSL